jgi:hypothetical protein
VSCSVAVSGEQQVKSTEPSLSTAFSTSIDQVECRRSVVFCLVHNHMRASDQTGKIGLQKLHTAVSFYNGHQIVQHNLNPLFVSLIGGVDSNTGKVHAEGGCVDRRYSLTCHAFCRCSHGLGRRNSIVYGATADNITQAIGTVTDPSDHSIDCIS